MDEAAVDFFTTDGKLIGVCNAAVVDVDEGVYTALDTVYWQLAKANLTELFSNQNLALATNTRDRDRLAMANNRDNAIGRVNRNAPQSPVATAHPADLAVFSLNPENIRGASELRGSNPGWQRERALAQSQTPNVDRGFDPKRSNGLNADWQNNVEHLFPKQDSAQQGDELIVIYRSRLSPGKLTTRTISNPDTNLLAKLGVDRSGQLVNRGNRTTSTQRMAQLRQEMPNLSRQADSGRNQNAKYWNRKSENSVRAQSPR